MTHPTRLPFRYFQPVGKAGVCLALGLAVALAGCTSVKLDRKGPRPGDASATVGADQPGDGGVSSVAPVTTTPAVDPLSDPNSPLSRRSVFFQFDSFVVQPEFQPVVEEHARYLTAHRDRRIVIEGNTDESGSREYNLALGQKRADAVRRALATLGVEDSQMESISFGEEKPRSSGGDEASMAENRRADLNYR